jgi:phosphonate degradation associated HDIG domain protein
MNNEQAGKIIDEIFGMYKSYGGEAYAGEKVTQLEHMVQAAELAEEEGYEEDVVLAAFLHDIGHITESAAPEEERMGKFGIRDHEVIGASFLQEKGFSKKVVRLVVSHVEAKRYLTVRDPSYYARLSDASKRTLEYQGGPMTEAEATAFEQYPLFALIIKMRTWDEEAKIEHKPLPDLEKYRQMMLRHLTSIK